MENVQVEDRLVERLIRISEVKRLTGLSTATLYRKISAGDFPRPVQLGAAARAWVLSEIQSWIAKRIAQREIAPLSVIITTLASRSYEWCVTNREYDNELELLFDVIRHMPDTIEVRHVGGRVQWFIWNETTTGENFAEKWNCRPERAEAFYAWHERLCSDLAQLEAVSGLDRLGDMLKGLFGSRPATAAMDSLTQRVSTARRAGNLHVAPTVGLSIGASPASTSVRANTFYGSSR
jgi:predicted DNA-binding transcriptional regulator AlpA